MADQPAGRSTSNIEIGTGAGNSSASATEQVRNNSNPENFRSLKRPLNESTAGPEKRHKNAEQHNNQDSSDLPDDFLQPLSPDETEIVSPPCSLILPAPRQTKKYDSKQFWKAGLLPSATSSSAFAAGGIEHARVHPKFLHSNATSHKWVFGAIAELLDNAVDEIRNGATFVKVDVIKNPRNGQPMLLVEDDGGGMDPEGIRHCMSLGFSAKSKLSNTIGQYGNGFKTSTMRLGADVIVFTRNSGSRPSESIGMMSYSFLATTGQDDIVVPIVDFQIQPFGIRKILRGSVDDWNESMEVIEQWSPYSSQAELVEQFKGMPTHGTKVVIYNLWEDEEGDLELDFSADPFDIQINGVTRDPKNIKLAERYPSCRHYFTYRHSLRTYVSILYLKLPPTFKIFLRGKEVHHHSLRDEMMFIEEMTYKPSWKYDPSLKDPAHAKAYVTLGFVKDAMHHVDCQGFSVYHKNRLIKPFWRIWKNSDTRGRGIIGILEANFVEPAHDKQGFEMTIVLSRLENRLVEMQRNYWQMHYSKIGYGVQGSRGGVNVRTSDQGQGNSNSRVIVNGIPGQAIARAHSSHLQGLSIPQEVGSLPQIHGLAHGLQTPVSNTHTVMTNSNEAQEDAIRFLQSADPQFLTAEQISSLPARFGIEPFVAVVNAVRANLAAQFGIGVTEPTVLNNGSLGGRETSASIAVSNESRIHAQVGIIDVDSRDSSPVVSPKRTFDTTEKVATANCELPVFKEVTGLSSITSASCSAASASEVHITTAPELLSSRNGIVECENAAGPTSVSGTNAVTYSVSEGTVSNNDFTSQKISLDISDKNGRLIPGVANTNDGVGNLSEMSSACQSNSPDVGIANPLNPTQMKSATQFSSTNHPRAENVDGCYRSPCENADKEVGNTVNAAISVPSLEATLIINGASKDGQSNHSTNSYSPSQDLDNRASNTMAQHSLEGTSEEQIAASTQTNSEDITKGHELRQIPSAAEGQELLDSLANIYYVAEAAQHAQRIMDSDASIQSFNNGCSAQEIGSNAAMLLETEKHKQKLEHTENSLQPQQNGNNGIPSADENQDAIAEWEGTTDPETTDNLGEKDIIREATQSSNNATLAQEIGSDVIMLVESEKHKQNIEHSENGLQQSAVENQDVVADWECTIEPETIVNLGEKDVIHESTQSSNSDSLAQEIGSGVIMLVESENSKQTKEHTENGLQQSAVENQDLVANWGRTIDSLVEKDIIRDSTQSSNNGSLATEICSDVTMLVESKKHKQNKEHIENGLQQSAVENQDAVADWEGSTPVTNNSSKKDIIPGSTQSLNNAVMSVEYEKHKQNIEHIENYLQQKQDEIIPPTVETQDANTEQEGNAPVSIEGLGDKDIIPNSVASIDHECRSSDDEYVDARGPVDDLLNIKVDDRKRQLSFRILHAQEILGNLRQNIEATIKERDDLKRQLEQEHMEREFQMKDLNKQLEAALARLEELQA